VIAPDVVIPVDTTITEYVQIASGVQLGAGCHIVGPVFLGAGAVIGDGSTIMQSVVETGATVGNGCHVDHAVLGRGSMLAHDGVMEYSLLDEEVVLPAGVHMRAHLFTDLHPVAETTGLLSHDVLCHRGAIVGKKHDTGNAQREPEHIVAGTVVPPGRILMHG
jgi:NDP-sugar pyrophosphorylase family protein